MRVVPRGDRGVDRRWFRSSLAGAARILAAGALLIGCASDGADEGDEVASVSSRSPEPEPASSATRPSAIETTLVSGESLDDSDEAATSVARSTTSTSSTGTGPGPTAGQSVPETPEVVVLGYAFSLPEGWEPFHDALIATEFQQQALACGSAEVIDDPAPPDSGQASLAHAVVQLCVSERDDDLDLEAWLTERGLTSWSRRSYGQCDVLEVPGGLERQLAYAQTPTTRAEIAVMVTTTPVLTERRRDDVEAALATMRCPTT